MKKNTGSSFPILCFSTLAAAAAVCLAAGEPTRAVIKNQGFLPFADAPIFYRSQNLSDPVAILQKRLDRGEATLRYEPQHGYLRSVLEALRIPVSSQTLVFSKTSFQFPQITPATPRALYYNDDVYVGQVHSSKFLEFVSFDPTQGAIFYILDERQTNHPTFERAETDCLQCHVGSATRGVPGVMLKSVLTKPSGYPAAGSPAFITGHESPWNQRWGGWYVTAREGAPASMSTNLSPAAPVDTSTYLINSSDLVALLVLAHQTQMHNLITQTNYQTRLALFAKEPGRQWETAAEQLVRYLLFTNEAPFPTPLAGASQFAEEFAARGPRDGRGRSLRDFDLRRRIFKYPCSYLIYSDDFNAIPQPAKDFIYRRLLDVLSGREQDAAFAFLSQEDRSAILEILVATKPDLPPDWRAFVAAANHQPLTQ